MGKRLIVGLFAVAMLAGLAMAQTDDGSLKVYWKDGLRLDSTSGAFKVKIGGLVANDWAWFAPQGDTGTKAGDVAFENAFTDGTEFRYARICTEGTIYDNVFFKAEYDFAAGMAQFIDVYMGVQKIPVVGAIRVGHINEAFGLEQQTYSGNTTFMEVSLPTAVFAPGRNTGVLLNGDYEGRVTWAADIVRPDSDAQGYSQKDGEYAAGARVTGVPWVCDDYKKLLHLGAALRYSGKQTGFAFGESPEVGLAPTYVTNAINVKSLTTLGLEGAFQYDSLTIQAEFMNLWVAGDTGFKDSTFCGVYLQGAYLVTGEVRDYDKTTGSFGRVRPSKNLSWGQDKGFGAVELALRYSYADLKDKDTIQGAEVNNFTAGVNWYLNSNMKVMSNYIFSDFRDQGTANIFAMRFQVDF